ncbi:MAG: hypothetical protein Ct9H90mP1_0650 [Methanobacteriota archaeon]|nr:MAG: hypothetical protein Ct9H90mP1_0650 [Euryarchaeota archaeon]
MGLDEKVVRLEDSSCHPVLVSLGEEHGRTILGDLLGLVGEEAEGVSLKTVEEEAGIRGFSTKIKRVAEH